MTQKHQLSYLKTASIAAAIGAAAVLVAWLLARWLHPVLAVLPVIAASGVAVLAWAVATGGLIALYRDQRDREGDVDWFRHLNRSRTDMALAGGEDAGLWRRATRWMLGPSALLVGEEVEVCSYEEIARTLDVRGCLDDMPFLAEMHRFCGKRARVFRLVDKIYDYGRTKGLRRLEDTYLLTGLRCDGSAHGGCQARCALMWKGAWLKRVEPDAAAAGAVQQALRPTRQSAELPAKQKYICQFTELARASVAISPWDIRQDLRPLLAGNVTLAAFLVVVLTQFFNAVQRRRGGVGYPPFAPGVLASTPAVTHGLQAGDMVRVLGAMEIHRTLDKNNKNRGLWFDQDMLKHCGKTYSVLARVDRIIDNTTGEMRLMKSPCIVLDQVEYSGEALRFCPQEEYLYWREAWLAPLARGTDSTPVVDRVPMRNAG